MTLLQSNRVRIAIVCALAVLFVGGFVSWVLVQDRQYRQQWDRAVERHFKADDQQVRASLSDKHAVSATNLPRPVKGARIGVVINDELARIIGQDLTASESVDPPLRWNSRHELVIRLSRATRDLFSARAEQQRYVADYLGEAPTLRMMADLPSDPGYVEASARVRRMVDRAEAAESKLRVSDPPFASVLSGSLATTDDRDYAKSYSEKVVTDLAACARERLRGSAPTAAEPLDVCDPSPTSPERIPTRPIGDPTRPPNNGS